MAFIDSRPGRRGYYVYYHDKNSGKLKQIPRKDTKHLDGKPIAEAQAWVDAWERKHGVARDRSQRMNLHESDLLAALWDRYQQHRMATRKRRQRSVEKETAVLENHILPFFIRKLEKKNPAQWHDHVPAFHTHLYKLKFKDATVREILWALERFGQFLVFQRHMSFPFAVQVPARENKKITPLKSRLSPDEVIEFAKSDLNIQDTDEEKSKHASRKPTVTPNDLKLATLIGYFVATRPSELWALEKADLLTGPTAEKYTKTLPGLKTNGLGTRLSISITKTIMKNKGAVPINLTKSDTSEGVVNVWHPEAAKLIAELVKVKPDGRLFSLTPSGMEQAMKRYVRPKIKTTVHDLRRASCLHLGRVKRIPVTLLQEHMRHAEIETTLLYMREPATPEKRSKRQQNFDDVL